MNSVTVNFLNGTSKTFGAATIRLSYEQFWLRVLDENNNEVAGIPREQILYVVTNMNTAA
ncbi:MAG: hypothetical protein ACXV5J_00305 [Candidatus Angelobacter sp.]